ncbi:unnamed protein product [Fraxinus pennsylvanica]|uniref:Uncharacterized protein n=1 Tax=Fraxinus pennsylvanica TaxID=56036 RepID=A0AAD2AEL3_9LAMI|nr:unnamed protein product [Fraxinus pennsylvanica]
MRKNIIYLCACLLAQLRGLKKRKEAVDEEARLALEDYKSSLKQLEGKGGQPSRDMGALSGRRVFGVRKQQVQETSKKVKTDNYYGESDSKVEFGDKEDEDSEHGKNHLSVREVNIDPDLLREESEISHDPVFKVVKRAGVSIKPNQFQDVNPHEKVENHKRKGQRPSKGKDKSRSMKKK